MAQNAQYPKIGKVTTESVKKGSGKDWDEWIPILEKAGARAWTHAEIVAFLKKKYKLKPWWQQGVTRGFEIAIGRVDENKNAKGELMLTVTKSMPIDAKALWKLLLSKEGQEVWLKPLFDVKIAVKASFETTDGYFGEVRTLTKERRIRLSWKDSSHVSEDAAGTTYVQVMLVARAGKRSILGFDHSKILDPRVQSRMRARWREAADQLHAMSVSDSDK